MNINVKEVISKASSSLAKAPEGHLRICSSRKYTYLLWITPEGKKRLNTADEKLARQLAQKDYDLKIIREAKKYIKSKSNVTELAFTKIFTSLHPQRKSRVKPYFTDNEMLVQSWLNEKWLGKPIRETDTFYLTGNGEKVRSKSEVIIADKLKAMGIPYRYECPLALKTFGIVYPDFTLITPYTGKVIIYEHFGMMDNPEYANSAIKKIQTYAENGYFAGQNFIFTFESLAYPLNIKTLELTLKAFICKD